MSLDSLYHQHVKTLAERVAPFIEESSFDSVVISSGIAKRFFQDDCDAPLRINPHFAHWCPIYGPHHLIILKAGETPMLLYYHPSDYWEEFAPLSGEGWEQSFDIESFSELKAMWKRASEFGNTAFIGEKKEADLHKSGFSVNPEEIVLPFNWGRKFKTDYEIACTRVAVDRAAAGHKKAEQLFHQGATEREIYWAYSQITEAVPKNVGYEPIIALNEKGSILHYRDTRENKVDNKVLLLDAGNRYRHYNSDITRTILADSVSDTFRTIHNRLDKAQQELCVEAKVGASYLSLNMRAVEEVGKILIDAGIIKGNSVEQAIEKKLVKHFFPHSLGHLLGVQVHDVGAELLDPMGKTTLPKSGYFPNLRFSGVLEEGYLLTVEPGIYFNPVLLEQARSNTNEFDWPLIDGLMQYGGVRIEDNVLITSGESENLSRPHIPQPL